MQRATSMTDSPAVAASTPPPPTRATRLLRGVIALLAATGVGLVLVCCVATLALYELIPAWLSDSLYLAVPILGAVATIWALRKNASLRLSLPVLCGSGLFLLYLAWDEPAPPPTPPLAPLVPADSKSYETYLWFMKNVPGSRLQEQPARKTALPYVAAEVPEWAAGVLKERATWEAAWTADTLGREWYVAMAAHVPEGLYPEDGNPERVLSFAPLRNATQSHWAHAYLLQHDGHPDEAAQVLFTILRANYHLQSGTATFLGQAMAVVCVRGTYKRLDLLLDADGLSPEVKAQAIALLRQARPVPESLHLAFLGEELYGRAAMRAAENTPADILKSLPLGANSHFAPAGLIGRLLFNPHRSEREYADFLHRYSPLAQARRTEDKAVMSSFESELKRRRVKNPIGGLLPTFSVTAFNAVAKSFWSTEDLRLVLLQRLESKK